MRKAVLFLVMVLIAGQLATGCASGPGRESEGETSAEKTEFSVAGAMMKMKFWDTALPVGNIGQMVCSGDRLYFRGTNGIVAACNTDGTGAQMIYRIAESSGHSEAESSGNSEAESGEYHTEKIETIAGDDQGGLLILVYSLSSDAEKYREEYRLTRIDPSGNEVWSVPLETGDAFPGGLVCAGNTVAVSFGRDICFYDGEGSLQNMFTLSEINRIDALYGFSDGRVMVGYSPDSGRMSLLSQIDPGTGELGEPADLFWTWAYRVVPGGQSGYDFLLWNDISLAGWNFGDTELTQLADFLASGISGEGMSGIIALGKEEFAALETSREISRVCTLSAMDGEEIPERQVITLAYLRAGSAELNERVREFNQTNDRYTVTVSDYGSMYGYPEAYDYLSQDISVGKIPDILLLDSAMPVDDYIRLGVLEDLYPWIDGDPELSREDFMTNVWEAFEVNGGLYQLVTQFQIQSVMGKSAVVGDASGWTMTEMRELEARNPDKKMMTVFSSTALYTALSYVWPNYVNETDGSCRFDTEEFAEFLEWVNEIQVDMEKWDPGEEKILYSASIHDFDSFLYDRWSRAGGEPITYIGFPGAPGNGAYINPSGIDDAGFAMSSRCACKEGAWQFIRTFLLEDYQSSVDFFPVSRDVLQRRMEEAFEPYLENERNSGRQILYQGVMAPPLSQAEADSYLNLLETTNRKNELDEDVYNIIFEDAGAFFAGQKSAAEVAEIIQGRVSIYLSEKEE